MGHNRAYDEKQIREAKEAVELCGKNRGPHNYIPIEWLRTDTSERVTRIMCLTCFCHVALSNILEYSKEVKY